MTAGRTVMVVVSMALAVGCGHGLGPMAPDQVTTCTAVDARVLHGTVQQAQVDGRASWVVLPDGPCAQPATAGQARPWIWLMPSQFFASDPVPGSDGVAYLNGWLDQGIIIAAVDITALGSPAGSVALDHFHAYMVATHHVQQRARLFVTSRGGLDGYAYAWRYPDNVDRIGGIFPATDWRDYPAGCWDEQAAAFRPGCVHLRATQNVDIPLGFTPDDVAHEGQLNPGLNALPTLAAHGIRLFHLHGDQDDTVHLAPNSLDLVARYQALGGSAAVEVVPGYGHFVYGFLKPSLAAFLGNR
jgi:hypothetical protein